jgi:hypothetical protein
MHAHVQVVLASARNARLRGACRHWAEGEDALMTVNIDQGMLFELLDDAARAPVS